MSSILEKYGIKEVADVTFYKILENGEAGAPVLYLDTLKVSTIEQTAESVSARGGKGNPELIKWDFGKEITVNLEDALFSAKSMALMYGVDTDADSTDFSESITTIKKTVPVNQLITKQSKTYAKVGDKEVELTGVAYYDARGNESSAGAEDAAYATGNIAITGTEIKINASNFPGTYYVTGDTYARSNTTGEDEFFQFIIPKAKMQSEVTLTLEAEGDPSTFNMSLTVLRPESGPMMKLVKYDIASAE